VDPLAATAVPDIDVTRPHPARMYDYYLGRKDH
jgi:S-adenosyl methyltransferase